MADNRATLKAFFETGDVPTQAQFAALIDGLMSVVDTDTVTGEKTFNADILFDDGRVAKAVNGGSELNLRDGGIDGASSLTSDNNAQLEGFLLVRPTFVEIGFNAAGDLFLNVDGARLSVDANNRIEVLTTGVTVCTASGKIGFYGATEIVKPTVTGSRAGNAALASLLTALDNLGLLTDSSTA